MDEMSLLSHEFSIVKEGNQQSDVSSSDRFIHDTYTLGEAKILCSVIKEITLFSSEIDWQKVAEEGYKHRNLFLSEADCCRLWKFLAYGEWYAKKEDALRYESDEEDFFFSPSEAIKRHQKRIVEKKENPYVNDDENHYRCRWKRSRRLLNESSMNGQHPENGNEEETTVPKKETSQATPLVDGATEFYLAKSPKADILNPIVSHLLLLLFLSFLLLFLVSVRL
jgi:hypothetical protein